MNYVNFWKREITLAVDAVTATLDLPDGTYALVISDKLGAGASAHEIVLADVASGTATLQRGQEDTEAQAWPAGSVVYCALTAGQLAAQSAAIEDLQLRVAQLENPVPANSVRVTLHVSGSVAGLFWLDEEQVGAVTPASLVLPGVGASAVRVAATNGLEFVFALAGTFSHSIIESFAVEGIGELLTSAATQFNASFEGEPATGYQWTIGAGDWDTGGERLVTLTFA